MIVAVLTLGWQTTPLLCKNHHVKDTCPQFNNKGMRMYMSMTDNILKI